MYYSRRLFPRSGMDLLTTRLENIENKLITSSLDDLNLLGQRIGTLEKERLNDQQSLIAAMSQIKSLTDQLNLFKRQHHQQQQQQQLQQQPLIISPQTHNNPTLLLTNRSLEDQMKELREEWNQMNLSFLRKEDLVKVKDLINFVGNDLRKDLQGFQTIMRQQQTEINLLKEQQQQQQQRPHTNHNIPQSPSPHFFDEISKRVLTLEIRMNHLTTPTPQPQSPVPIVPTSVTESLKHQVHENERSIHEALARLDQVTSQCDDQRLTLEDLKRKTDLKFKQQKDERLQTQQTETDLLNQIREIDQKTLQLERKIQEISRASPPSTPYLSTPITLAPQSKQIETPTKSIEQHLNHRLKTICDELQTSLQSIRKEMKTKHQDLQLLFEKSFLPCEGCGGAMPTYFAANQIHQINSISADVAVPLDAAFVPVSSPPFTSAIVHIKSIVANGLPAAELMGGSDPYTILAFNDWSFTTKVLENARSDVGWEYDPSDPQIQFEVTPENLGALELSAKVWDKNDIGSDTLIGQGSGSLQTALKLPLGSDVEVTFPLLNKKSKSAGLVTIVFLLEDKDDGKEEIKLLNKKAKKVKEATFVPSVSPSMLNTTGTQPLGVLHADPNHLPNLSPGTGNGYTPSPSLLNQRLCSRRCPACLDRLGLTSYTSKEMMEKLNEFNEHLNKVNKKLKIQHDKIHTISDKQEKVILFIDEIKDKVLNVIPKDIQLLFEAKVDRGDCTALIIEILRQYMPSVAGEGGGLSFGGVNSNEIEELEKKIRKDFILLHSTTKDSIEEEIKKLKKQMNSHHNSIQSHNEELVSLSQLSEKIHNSLLTHAANTSGGGNGSSNILTTDPNSMSPAQRERVAEYFGFDPEMKMAIKDLKAKIERLSERLDSCEGNQQQSEESGKKLRTLVDTTREEMKKNFKDHTQQLQHLKSTHLSGREIEDRIQHSISHLDPQIFHKDRIIEMRDDVEKLKRYEKILEKKISNQGDHLFEVIDEQKRITAEYQKRLESKLKSMTMEMQSHLEKHPAAHMTLTGGGMGTFGGTGFFPSFPSSPLYPHLSSTGGGVERYQEDSHSNSNPKLRTYPDAFRNSVFQGSLSPQEIASPEFNDEIAKQHEFRDQLDFEDYVRNTLNPVTEEKKKKKSNG